MTAGVMYHVADIRPCPAGWTVRVVTLDEDDTASAQTYPVIGLALLRSCAVADGLDADVTSSIQPAVLDELGDVTALDELRSHGGSDAVALPPGHPADDAALAARLRAERDERPPVALAPEPDPTPLRRTNHEETP